MLFYYYYYYVFIFSIYVKLCFGYFCQRCRNDLWVGIEAKNRQLTDIKVGVTVTKTTGLSVQPPPALPARKKTELQPEEGIQSQY